MHSLVQGLQTYANGNRRRPNIRYEPLLVKLPREIVDKFELSHCDAGTRAFMERARDFSLWRLLVADALRCVLSRTTANGLLHRGGMFVVSTAQACSLLRPAGAANDEAHQLPLPPSAITTAAAAATGSGENGAASTSPARDVAVYVPPFRRLLDIGAGDGGVTAEVAPLFREVFATEYSMTMRWRLRRRGYRVLGHEDPFHDPATQERRIYDVITCFNVLDRADHPLTLLRDMRDSLQPRTGLLLLAVVLPWCPFVEYNNVQRRPSELLPMEGGQCCKGASFEDSLAALVRNVLEPVGFELVRWTRLPYLCEGNLRLEYALLNDAVMVLRRKADGFVDTAQLAPSSQYD